MKIRGRELLELYHPDELNKYVETRRRKLTGLFRKDFAKAMDVHPQSMSIMLNGKRKFGPDMVRRLNEIDSEFELVPLLGLFRKKGSPSDVDL